MTTCGNVPDNFSPGPAEQRLRALVDANASGLDDALKEWKAQASALGDIAGGLRGQLSTLRQNGDTGIAAAQAFDDLASSLEERETELTNVHTGLQDSVITTRQSAKGKLAALPDVADPPDTDMMSMGIAKQWENHDGQKSAREAAATKAMGHLDTEFSDAAAVMGHVQTDDTTYGGGSQQTSAGSGSSLSSAPTPRGVSPQSVLTGTSEQGEPQQNHPIQPTVGQPHHDVVPTGSAGDGSGGDLSAGTTTTPGTGSVPVPGGNSGSSTSGIGGASAAIGAAGALTTAGSTAVAGRGGTGATSGPARSSAGAIGRSASGGASGNLGRGPMMPGQQGAAGQSGQGGRGTAGARSGAGRGMMPGQAGQQTQGKAGGRRGPLSSAATGGRSGKRDEDPEERDGFTYDDQAGWLDDDTTSDQVLD